MPLLSKMKTAGCQVCSQTVDCPLVDQFEAGSHDTLQHHALTQALMRGDLLFRAGENPTGIWGVCRGSIKTYRYASDGRTLINRIAGDGDFVGYRSFFLDRPYEGSAAAMEPSIVRFFNRAKVEELIGRGGTFAGLMLRGLAIDLGHAEDKATHMAYDSARNRVMDVLYDLHLAHKTGAEHPDDLVVRRQDLAEIAGLAVETIVRVLKDLESDGILALRGRHIQVTAPRLGRANNA